MHASIVVAGFLLACSPKHRDTAPPDPRPAPPPTVAAPPVETAPPSALAGPPSTPSPGTTAPLEIAESEACACENSVGVPIEETHCGYLICGTDRQVYRCGPRRGSSPWTLVQPVTPCAAPGRLQAEHAIELGGDCSSGQSCPAPSACVGYRGIAGARGPTFQTCEIRCDPKTACPTGTRCVRIADGPGEVCR